MNEYDQPTRLTFDLKQSAAELLGRAFLDDPMMQFIEPDDARRARFVTWLMGTVVTYCLLYGEVYATPGFEGVACWLPPGQTHFTPWRVIRAGIPAVRLKLTTAALIRFRHNELYLDRIQKRLMPGRHWYLFAVGVEPGCQGQGIGSRLLQPVLERANAAGMPCYLETHNPENLPFYEKHGFATVSAGEVPHHSLRVWAMVKRADRIDQ